MCKYSHVSGPVIKGLILYGNQNVTKNYLVLSDGYVKYEEAEVDNEKKKIKWPTGGHFEFYNCEICHGLSLCEKLHFFFIHGPANLHVFDLSKYHKINKIQNDH